MHTLQLELHLFYSFNFTPLMKFIFLYFVSGKYQITFYRETSYTEIWYYKYHKPIKILHFIPKDLLSQVSIALFHVLLTSIHGHLIIQWNIYWAALYSLMILFEFLPDLLGLFGCEGQKNTISKWFQQDPSLLLISTSPPGIPRCQGSSNLPSCCFPVLGFQSRDYYLGQNSCWSFNHYNHIPTRGKGDRR